MNAFVTGSRAYGKPKVGSDVDLVVLVSKEDMAILKQTADPVATLHPEYGDIVSVPLRFGKLNLIVTTSAIDYGVWLKGTERLEAMASHEPVSRATAVDLFKALRFKHGLRKTEK